jgi:hypothetical protein
MTRAGLFFHIAIILLHRLVTCDQQHYHYVKWKNLATSIRNIAAYCRLQQEKNKSTKFIIKSPASTEESHNQTENCRAGLNTKMLAYLEARCWFPSKNRFQSMLLEKLKHKQIIAADYS